MGGMVLVYGHHNGANPLSFMQWGKPTNLLISCWVGVGFEKSSHSVSSSLKNEIDAHEHGSHFMSSSLKNETNVLKHSYFLFQACVKMKQFPTIIVIFCFKFV